MGFPGGGPPPPRVGDPDIILDDPRFVITGEHARGGMSVIYRATDTWLGRQVAIKASTSRDPSAWLRLTREASMLSRLDHPWILPVYHSGTTVSGAPYLATKLVEGDTLEQRLKGAPAAWPSLLRHVVDVGEAMGFAHGRGVVHRDISPSNVLLSRAGEVKIADFGIARAAGLELSRTFQIMGKWRYMSPEQTRGDELAASSDVFSAAAVIHEVLTGQRLFPGNDPEAIVRAIREAPPPRPSAMRADLPPELDAPLAAALELDPARRIDTAGLLGALAEICYARSLPAMPISLARFLESLLPARRVGDGGAAERTGSGRILDRILSEELGQRAAAGKRDRTRVTAQALAPPPMHPDDQFDDGDAAAGGFVAPEATGTGMTFIRSVPEGDGLTRWLLEDETGTHQAAAEEADPTLVMSADRLPALSATGELDAIAPPAAIASPNDESAFVVAAAASALGPRRRLLAPLLAALAAAAAVGLLVWQPWTSTRADDGAASSPVSEPVPVPVPVSAPISDAVPEPEPVPDPAPELAFAPDLVSDPLPSDRKRRPRDEPAAPVEHGTLDLFSEPWADVYWNGKKIATAPQRAIKLPHGRHRLTLINPVQNRRTTITVSVPSGKPVKVALPP
jgi:hypothetical protein